MLSPPAWLGHDHGVAEVKATHLLDLFAIESQWTDDQRIVRDAVRGFAREIFNPRVQQAFREETFPDDLIPQIGALGVLGANLTGYGCAGLDSVSYGLAMRDEGRLGGRSKGCADGGRDGDRGVSCDTPTAE